MGLTLNRDKTSIRRLAQAGESLDFLGYTFRWDRDLRGRSHRYLNLFPSAKAVERVRDKIRTITRWSNRPIWETIEDLNRVLCGWQQYFGQGYPRKVFRDVNHFVLERFHLMLRHKSQRICRPFRAGETVYRGIRRYGYKPL